MKNVKTNKSKSKGCIRKQPCDYMEGGFCDVACSGYTTDIRKQVSLDEQVINNISNLQIMLKKHIAKCSNIIDLAQENRLKEVINDMDVIKTKCYTSNWD